MVRDAAEIDRAAAALVAARRVLVTGGVAVPPGTATRACDLAESLGAAVDFGGLETAQVAGPTIARIGEVTADPGELRDRADLVVFWFCDPALAAADFLHRFLTPATAAGRPRRTLAVGGVAVATSASADRHLPLAHDLTVDLARVVHAAVAGRAIPAPPAPLAAARDALVAAIASAGCVAFVTHHDDPVGLEPWSLVGLVRAIAHEKPAFEVPLAPAGGAAAVSTWRYGAAGAITRADRDGAGFRPAECDAVRLVARGEVDCVLAVGPPTAELEAALAARCDPPAVIRMSADGDASAALDALLAAVRPHRAAGGAP